MGQGVLHGVECPVERQRTDIVSSGQASSDSTHRRSPSALTRGSGEHCEPGARLTPDSSRPPVGIAGCRVINLGLGLHRCSVPRSAFDA
jgi:hypothetical protein